MKSRIGKLEGDGRTSKRMQESLGKHVKILENALKKEREKAKSTAQGEKREEKTDAKINAKEPLKPPSKREHYTSKLSLNADSITQLNHSDTRIPSLIPKEKICRYLNLAKTVTGTSLRCISANVFKKSHTMPHAKLIYLHKRMKTSRTFHRTIIIPINTRSSNL